MLKHSPTPSEELYLTTKPKEPAAASHRSSHGLDQKDLDKLSPVAYRIKNQTRAQRANPSMGPSKPDKEAPELQSTDQTH